MIETRTGAPGTTPLREPIVSTAALARRPVPDIGDVSVPGVAPLVAVAGIVLLPTAGRRRTVIA